MNDTIELSINNFSEVRGDWSRVLAFAWLDVNAEVLKGLRNDPRNTIMELARGADSRYQNVDSLTQSAAQNIIDKTTKDPSAAYRGYLPIPDPLEGLKNLTKEELENLLLNGITGILRFDKNADLWAEELLIAWNEPKKLINIRQDPANNLIHAKKLSEEGGIFPLPNRPRGLDKLEIEDLEKLFSDRDNMNHLAGIFLIGS